MTVGIGNSTRDEELSKLANMSAGISGITLTEYQSRISKAQELMRIHNISAIYVNAGTNLYYFTGTRWRPSERMVGALITADGETHYIAPGFEKGSIKGFMQIEGEVHCWKEHESPYVLLSNLLSKFNIQRTTIGIDESTSFALFDGIRRENPSADYVNAVTVTQGCRSIKSQAEITILQRAKDMSLEVHKAAAKILQPGMTTSEVNGFINEAHISVGATEGSYFCITLFGEDSAFPHGVSKPKVLEENDMVLIDTGCQVHGYNSDITRSYVLGEPNSKQREVWEIEKTAQAAAFDAAQLGAPCSAVDIAARKVIADHGFGPEYEVPGLPHRTGHGIGLDIHEGPYLVMNDHTPLEKGMCFSNEPTICVPGEFGIRHEDHFYMTESGPKWFTQPSHTIDDPFGYTV